MPLPCTLEAATPAHPVAPRAEGWSTSRAGRVRAPRPSVAATRLPEDLDHLLLKSARGDEHAFKRLYERSSAAIYARVRRAVWQHGEAEEVLQQVYLQIWANAARFDPQVAGAMTWMSRIARNAAIDHLRRRSTRRSYEDVASLEVDDDTDPTGIDQLADPEPGPEQLLQQRQLVAWVDGLLGRIPAMQRRVIVMAAREGRSLSEIADLCGAPLGSVKSWMRRGLLSLKVLIDAEAGRGG